MRTEICDRRGIEFPIVAFTHCRDVVAAVSQAGGLGVLGYARRSRAYVQKTRGFYQQQCKKLGLKTISGPSPFMLIKTGDLTGSIHQSLKDRKIMVGNGKSWNVPDYLRVSYGRESENQVFFKELKSLL